MPKVWLLARRAFTFKGTAYQEGQRFQAGQLDAIQMTAMRAVLLAKKPQEPVAAPPPPPIAEHVAAPRRRYTRPAHTIYASTVTDAPPSVVDQPADAPEPVAPTPDATSTPEA